MLLESQPDVVGRTQERAQRLKSRAVSRVGFLGPRLFFDGHVFEFAGFEYFTAQQALDKFSIFFPCHNLHARVLTLIHGYVSSRELATNRLES